MLKQNNNRVEALEETVKKMTTKIGTLVDQLNKMEDERKRWGMGGDSSLLPKIDKENKATNINPIEIIKKELKKVNEDLQKTNEKLSSTKDKLN